MLEPCLFKIQNFPSALIKYVYNSTKFPQIVYFVTTQNINSDVVSRTKRIIKGTKRTFFYQFLTVKYFQEFKA